MSGSETIVNGEKKKEEQGLAIASFVLALVGFNILGLIFGIIALHRKQLRWAALCGVIISAVKLVLAVLLLFGLFSGALIPRMSAAQGRARDVARKSDLSYISTALIDYNLKNQGLPESQNGCVGEITSALSLNPNISDPLSTPFQSGLFCSSDKLGYGYWTNGQNFVVSASIEHPSNANLCKTFDNDFVANFKNALAENNIESANDILKNIGDSCMYTGSSNLYYVILY